MSNVDKKTKKFKDLDKQAQSENERCIICFDDFKPDDDVTILSCSGKHIFHPECLKEWIKSDSNQSLSCPLCKQAINDVQVMDEEQ